MLDNLHAQKEKKKKDRRTFDDLANCTGKTEIESWSRREIFLILCLRREPGSGTSVAITRPLHHHYSVSGQGCKPRSSYQHIVDNYTSRKAGGQILLRFPESWFSWQLWRLTIPLAPTKMRMAAKQMLVVKITRASKLLKTEDAIKQMLQVEPYLRYFFFNRGCPDSILNLLVRVAFQVP